MGVHDYHQGLPGYHPNQILHEGCRECEHRGQRPRVALTHLDQSNFRRAWERAAQWNYGQLEAGDHIAVTEVELLETLWSIQILLEREGVPIGTLPVPT